MRRVIFCARGALTPLDLNRSRKKAIKTGEISNTKSFGSQKIKHAELTRATRQLAILIDVATPVEDALRVTALQFEKSPMKGVLLSIRSQVVEGATLSQALRSQPQAFSDLYVAMVASGETSGQLPRVLLRLADDLEAAQAIRPENRGRDSLSYGAQRGRDCCDCCADDFRRAKGCRAI